MLLFGYMRNEELCRSKDLIKLITTQHIKINTYLSEQHKGEERTN